MPPEAHWCRTTETTSILHSQGVGRTVTVEVAEEAFEQAGSCDRISPAVGLGLALQLLIL